MTEGRDDLERFCLDAWPRLVLALAHQFRDPFLAEELAQEALVRVTERWSAVRGMDNPLGWAFVVGSNLGRSRLRRWRLERRVRQRWGREDLPVVDQSDERVELHEALAALPERQRRAVILRYVVDLSVEQTAQVMAMSPGALRVLTHRAVARLRGALVEEYIDE